MATEIVVPTLGESVSEATVAKWFKSVGEAVTRDEPLVELETDKVTLEVNAPVSGVLSEIVAQTDADVGVGALLGKIDGDGKAAAKPAPKQEAKKEEKKEEKKAEAPAPAPAAKAPEAPKPAPASSSEAPLSPAVRKLIEDNDLDPAAIPATGKDGRLVKGDVLAYLEKGGAAKPAAPASPAASVPAVKESPRPASGEQFPPRKAGPREERVRMSRLRKMVAERLKTAQNTAAMLTTFNEVDMTAVIEARNQYRDVFEKKHGVRLGFMSFFTKACIVALREFPAVNAEIDGEELVYKNYYNIGVAVGTDRGLVVPVLRDAQELSLADIEKTINDFGKRARDGNLKLDELQGGTFTISNGGVYGSLMSTPILNAPQSGILGMHKIQER
ncbi:MAG: 2-oxoglutarate dehydrogenase complex dihydrolipoyllysine-residue succinyltransferase, partial [Rhodospirillales bacterium]